MGFKTQSVYTGTFTNTSLVITDSMNITILSVNLLSGAATILGNQPIPGQTLSAASMTVGQPVLLKADPGFTLNDITIDSTGGGVFEVIAK
jgi:hypothetical protein